MHYQANIVWTTLPSPSRAVFCLIDWLNNVKQFTCYFVSKVQNKKYNALQFFLFWQSKVTSNVFCPFKEFFESNWFNYLVWYIFTMKMLALTESRIGLFECLMSELSVCSSPVWIEFVLTLSLKTPMSIWYWIVTQTNKINPHMHHVLIYVSPLFHWIASNNIYG